MPVQTKEQKFKELKETMDKVTKSINALEIKMTSNHKKLMNKFETVEKKTDEALQLARDHTFMMFTRKSGGGVLKFVTCLQILLFLKIDLLIIFADGGGRGSKNWSFFVGVTNG